MVLCNFNKSKYDGRQSDIWSCGVMLYLMLMGAYPFQDGSNPAMFSKTVKVASPLAMAARRYIFQSGLRFSNIPVEWCRDTQQT